MEKLLEIILQVEKEAASIENTADEALAEIKRQYRVRLDNIETSSLKEVYRKLEEHKAGETAELSQAKKEIFNNAELKCTALKARGKEITDEAVAAIVKTLLPGLK